MKREPISVVVSVLNEESTILELLQTLAKQVYKPAEIVVIDGGSTDQTWKLLTEYQQIHRSIPLRIEKTKTNISQARNRGVKQANSAWIASTDAGCVPEPTWLEELWRARSKTQARVVAGYYYGTPNSALERAQVPFVLVMPDQLDPENFLPASRSMLIEKELFLTLGGFNEKLPVSEDYELARRLRRVFPPIKMVMAPQARVSWRPRPTLWSFAKMVFRQAKWDVVAASFRPRVSLIFARYLVGLILVSLLWWSTDILVAFLFSFLLFVLYSIWVTYKHRRHVPFLDQGLLPILQVTSDVAVMAGASVGLVSRFTKR